MGKSDYLRGRFEEVRGFIDGLYGHDLHAKRADALAGATLGVMASASLAVALIGQALAQARGLVTKHAVKQVDRLLSNQGIGGGRRMAYVLVQPNPPIVALSRLLRRGMVRSGHFAQAHRPARGTEKRSRVLELPGFQANAVAPATAGLPRGPGRECW